ncbi:MAG: hypothetical protein ABF271_04990 [Abyssibacter sp.]|uniref:LVIVD repeat-containing protein n=1 Tax=Abyssibacter sp. TaxID=2320200 RepID=UPI00321BC574
MRTLIVASCGVLVACSLAACSGSDTSPSTPVAQQGPVPKAACGPGSVPETGMQGRVSAEDHAEGRAAEGFRCNMEVVGSYLVPNAIGTVGGFKVERYIDNQGNECAYYDSTLLYPTNALDAEAGVNVMDMSDPSNPQLVTRLLTPAMLTPHESLVVSQQAGVLAAVTGNPGFYPGNVDVYDISEDCRSPVLRSSALVGNLGHESGLAPDGRTFYSANPGTPTLVALDITNPLVPTRLWTGPYYSHGLSISNDGNRAYIASGDGQGMLILDVSEIQARAEDPQVYEVANITWPNLTIPQNAIPFTRNGRDYVIEIDEYSADSPDGGVAAHGDVVGAGRIIDISDETQPVIVSDLRLEVHEPENRDEIAGDPGAQLPVQGYAGHYCNIPTRVNPDIVACSMIVSGLRVFDIRDPANPKEIAYFNAPVNPRITPVFEASNWAMSSPAFAPERKEIWYTDGYSGFYVLRVTNGVW